MGSGFSFVSFWVWFWVLETEEAREGNEQLRVRTSIRGGNEVQGTREGTDVALFTRLFGFYGVFSLGVMGLYGSMSLEGFSGYVPRGLSVNGCIGFFSSALWTGFRCFLGGLVWFRIKLHYQLKNVI